jgi:hypothetical protein
MSKGVGPVSTLPKDPERCESCKKQLGPTWTNCQHCKAPFQTDFAAARVAAGLGFDRKMWPAVHQYMAQQPQTVLVRRYTGTSQAQASFAFAADSQMLANQGWRVVSQSWDSGTRGVAGVIALGLFSPKHGTLTVTYERASAGAAAPSSSTADELRKLAQLRSDGILSDVEFEAAKARLLARGD